MNIHTFKDAATAKRNALSNDLDIDDDDQEVAALKKDVEGEEEDGQVQVEVDLFMEFLDVPFVNIMYHSLMRLAMRLSLLI